MNEKDYIEDIVSPTEISSHELINQDLSGHIIKLEKNYAKSVFKTNKEMVIDKSNNILSSFLLCGAEYTAVSAVNDINTIVIATKSNFFVPVKVNSTIEFEAFVKYEDLSKKEVKVIGVLNEIKILECFFQIIILDKENLLKTIK